MTLSLPARAHAEIDGPTLERVRRMMMQMAGIALSANKASMVRARMSKRLAITGHPDFGSYLDFIEGSEGADERSEFISVMTTNVTHFFRESQHFDRLAAIASTHRPAGQSLKIWSAGCSSGPEPYSIAMTLADASLTAATARILATDIDLKILAKARTGEYTLRELDGLSPDHKRKYLTSNGQTCAMSPSLKAMIDFRPLNLNSDWPIRTKFDVIFCRNVAIYFDAPTQERLWSRLIDVLRPGGFLFVGHSERLTGSTLESMTYLGQTSYQKNPCPVEKDGAR